MKFILKCFFKFQILFWFLVTIAHTEAYNMSSAVCIADYSYSPVQY
jgi:hypothetical protein